MSETEDECKAKQQGQDLGSVTTHQPRQSAPSNSRVCSMLRQTGGSCIQGPVLRTIQRFGKLGRRSGQNAAEANARDSDNGMKNAKYMFISLDEAGSHVKVKHFR